MKYRLILVWLVFLTVCCGAGCHAVNGLARDAHGISGLLVDATTGMEDRVEYRDVVAEQKRLNHRVKKISLLRRMQGRGMDD